jgi:hypothetical protein
VIVGILCAGIISGASFGTTLLFLRENPPIGIASSALLHVARALEARSGSVNLVCVDYSICSPLTFLLGSKAKILADYSFSPRDEGLIQQIDSVINDRHAILILRRIETVGDPGYLKFLNSGSELVLEKGRLDEYQLVGRFDDNVGTTFTLYLKR